MATTIEVHRRRDQVATATVAGIELALARRAAADRDVADGMVTLLGLGYSPTETGELTGQSAAEIRRLRKRQKTKLPKPMRWSTSYGRPCRL